MTTPESEPYVVVKNVAKHSFYVGNALHDLKTLPDEYVNCCVTSPPYWGLRNYGIRGQIGLEKTPEEYVEKLVEIFREVRRVLRKDGTLWLNLGDSYANPSGGQNDFSSSTLTGGENARDPLNKHVTKFKSGLKPKNLVGIPWRVAFALQADGWYLRSDIIWHKSNALPESVKDRPTKAHEYVFLLAKSRKYYYDYEAIREPANYDGRKATKMKGSQKYKSGDYMVKTNAQNFHSRGHERWTWVNGQPVRNKRTVWTIPTKPFKGAHFAVFPPDLVKPCVLAGCPEGGIVLDPFGGAGTTSLVAEELSRNSIYIDIKRDYADIAVERLKDFIQRRSTNVS